MRCFPGGRETPREATKASAPMYWSSTETEASRTLPFIRREVRDAASGAHAGNAKRGARIAARKRSAPKGRAREEVLGRFTLRVIPIRWSPGASRIHRGRLD